MDQQDRDLLIRIDENVEALKEDLKALDRVVHGNGQPGLKDRLQAIETSHLDCIFRQGDVKETPVWPAPVAAICAIIAVFSQFLFK